MNFVTAVVLRLNINTNSWFWYLICYLWLNVHKILFHPLGFLSLFSNLNLSEHIHWSNSSFFNSRFQDQFACLFSIVFLPFHHFCLLRNYQLFYWIQVNVDYILRFKRVKLISQFNILY